MTKGRVQEIAFYSQALQEEIALLIYLPASFTPLHKYTLVIAQDGKDYLQFGKAAGVLEALQSEGKIDRTIFIGIPYRNTVDRKEKYHPNGTQNKAYMRFLAHELVPYLDKQYPTYQMGKGRVLIGDSLGGTVSLLSAFLYPHTFGKAIIQSPFVNAAVLEQARSFTHHHVLELYHTIGTNETDVTTTDGSVHNFIDPNRELFSILQAKHFPYHYEEFQGGHTWKYWQENLPRAFSLMLAAK